MKHDIKQSNESPMSGYLKHTISFVAGFLIAIFAEPLQHFLFRPALHLEFIGSPAKDSPYLLDTPDRSDSATYNSRWLRISVRNVSRHTAIGCRAFITKIERKNDSGEYITFDHDALPLTWAYLGTGKQDLPPDLNLFFDLIHYSERNDSLRFSASATPNIWLPYLAKPGVFRLTVAVFGDNVSVYRETVEVTWKGGMNLTASTSVDNSLR